MARADHIQRQIESGHFIYLLCDELAERRQDIGIILQCLIEQLGLIHQVVVHVFGAIMLTESVVAEQDIVPGQIAEHAVRPVQHLCLNENEAFFAQAQFVAGLDSHEIPVLMIMAFQ